MFIFWGSKFRFQKSIQTLTLTFFLITSTMLNNHSTYLALLCLISSQTRHHLVVQYEEIYLMPLDLFSNWWLILVNCLSSSRIYLYQIFLHMIQKYIYLHKYTFIYNLQKAHTFILDKSIIFFCHNLLEAKYIFHKYISIKYFFHKYICYKNIFDAHKYIFSNNLLET